MNALPIVHWHLPHAAVCPCAAARDRHVNLWCRQWSRWQAAEQYRTERHLEHRLPGLGVPHLAQRGALFDGSASARQQVCGLGNELVLVHASW